MSFQLQQPFCTNIWRLVIANFDWRFWHGVTGS